MDIEEKIIEFVRANQILVDKISKKQEKDKKWDEICTKLSISDFEAKRKWRNIRDRYYRLKKQPPRKRPYKYEALLSFLDESPNEGSKFMESFIYDHKDDSLYAISDDSQTRRNEDIQSIEAICADVCGTTVNAAIVETPIREDGENVGKTFCDNLPNSKISHNPLFEKVKSGELTASACESDDPIAAVQTDADLLKIMSSFKEACNNTKEKSFCNNLSIQLQDAALPTKVFAKFQFEVYQAFYSAVQENTKRNEVK